MPVQTKPGLVPYHMQGLSLHILLVNLPRLINIECLFYSIYSSSSFKIPSRYHLDKLSCLWIRDSPGPGDQNCIREKTPSDRGKAMSSWRCRHPQGPTTLLWCRLVSDLRERRKASDAKVKSGKSTWGRVRLINLTNELPPLILLLVVRTPPENIVVPTNDETPLRVGSGECDRPATARSRRASQMTIACPIHARPNTN